MARLGSEWADMGATPRAESWRGMRSLRADPPGLAVGDRKATFVMALEQAEQLFIAAENTGPAARPLPLFYGLSQAGRALLATKVPGDPWRPRSHGIGEVRGGVAAPTVAAFEFLIFEDRVQIDGVETQMMHEFVDRALAVVGQQMGCERAERSLQRLFPAP